MMQSSFGFVDKRAYLGEMDVLYNRSLDVEQAFDAR